MKNIFLVPRAKPTAWIAGTLSVFLFLQGSLFAYAPETNFWKERQKNVSETNTESGSSTQLASLPANLIAHPTQIFDRLPSSLPNPLTSAIPSQIEKGIPIEMKTKLGPILKSLSSQYGSIRKVSIPEGKIPEKTIIHIQDVHLNQEAQGNIGKAIQSLVDQKKIDLVGLEGAFTTIDLKDFRAFEDKEASRVVADYLLRENRISGAVHALYSSPAEIPFLVGVDDPIHYHANVQAYKNSLPVKNSTKKHLEAAQKDLALRSPSTLNPELASFHSRVSAFREGTLSMGEYFKFLSEHVSGYSSEVEIFLEAYKLETSLDFKKVESERTTLLSQLLEKLNKTETTELLNTSIAYRVGNINHTAFYEYLKNICAKNQVSLSKFQAMDAYIHYVLLSDGINPDKLFPEINRLEKQVYTQLTKTDIERQLVEESKRLYLIGKLVDFSLTPDEWNEYSSFRRKPESSPLIGISGFRIETFRDDGLKSFEQFYTEAELRNHTITKNLINRMDENKASVAVLVTGGFHSPGIDQLMKEAGVTTITFVPKITKVDSENGSAYLSVFAQEKTPLDKLFAGEKLFVAQDPGERFSQSNLGPSLEGAAVLGLHPQLTENKANRMVQKVRRVPGLKFARSAMDTVEILKGQWRIYLEFKKGIGIETVRAQTRVEDFKTGFLLLIAFLLPDIHLTGSFVTFTFGYFVTQHIQNIIDVRDNARLIFAGDSKGFYQHMTVYLVTLLGGGVVYHALLSYPFILALHPAWLGLTTNPILIAAAIIFILLISEVHAIYSAHMRHNYYRSLSLHRQPSGVAWLMPEKSRSTSLLTSLSGFSKQELFEKLSDFSREDLGQIAGEAGMTSVEKQMFLELMRRTSNEYPQNLRLYHEGIREGSAWPFVRLVYSKIHGESTSRRSAQQKRQGSSADLKSIQVKPSGESGVLLLQDLAHLRRSQLHRLAHHIGMTTTECELLTNAVLHIAGLEWEVKHSGEPNFYRPQIAGEEGASELLMEKYGPKILQELLSSVAANQTGTDLTPLESKIQKIAEENLAEYKEEAKDDVNSYRARIWLMEEILEILGKKTKRQPKVRPILLRQIGGEVKKLNREHIHQIYSDKKIKLLKRISRESGFSNRATKLFIFIIENDLDYARHYKSAPNDYGDETSLFEEIIQPFLDEINKKIKACHKEDGPTPPATGTVLPPISPKLYKGGDDSQDADIDTDRVIGIESVRERTRAEDVVTGFLLLIAFLLPDIHLTRSFVAFTFGYFVTQHIQNIIDVRDNARLIFAGDSKGFYQHMTVYLATLLGGGVVYHALLSYPFILALHPAWLGLTTNPILIAAAIIFILLISEVHAVYSTLMKHNYERSLALHRQPSGVAWLMPEPRKVKGKLTERAATYKESLEEIRIDHTLPGFAGVPNSRRKMLTLSVENGAEMGPTWGYFERDLNHVLEGGKFYGDLFWMTFFDLYFQLGKNATNLEQANKFFGSVRQKFTTDNKKGVITKGGRVIASEEVRKLAKYLYLSTYKSKKGQVANFAIFAGTMMWRLFFNKWDRTEDERQRVLDWSRSGAFQKKWFQIRQAHRLSRKLKSVLQLFLAFGSLFLAAENKTFGQTAAFGQPTQSTNSAQTVNPQGIPRVIRTGFTNSYPEGKLLPAIGQATSDDGFGNPRPIVIEVPHAIITQTNDVPEKFAELPINFENIEILIFPEDRGFDLFSNFRISLTGSKGSISYTLKLEDGMWTAVDEKGVSIEVQHLPGQGLPYSTTVVGSPNKIWIVFDSMPSVISITMPSPENVGDLKTYSLSSADQSSKFTMAIAGLNPRSKNPIINWLLQPGTLISAFILSVFILIVRGIQTRGFSSSARLIATGSFFAATVSGFAQTSQGFRFLTNNVTAKTQMPLSYQAPTNYWRLRAKNIRRVAYAASFALIAALSVFQSWGAENAIHTTTKVVSNSLMLSTVEWDILGFRPISIVMLILIFFFLAIVILGTLTILSSGNSNSFKDVAKVGIPLTLVFFIAIVARMAIENHKDRVAQKTIVQSVGFNPAFSQPIGGIAFEKKVQLTPEQTAEFTKEETIVVGVNSVSAENFTNLMVQVLGSPENRGDGVMTSKLLLLSANKKSETQGWDVAANSDNKTFAGTDNSIIVTFKRPYGFTVDEVSVLSGNADFEASVAPVMLNEDGSDALRHKKTISLSGHTFQKYFGDGQPFMFPDTTKVEGSFTTSEAELLQSQGLTLSFNINKKLTGPIHLKLGFGSDNQPSTGFGSLNFNLSPSDKDSNLTQGLDGVERKTTVVAEIAMDLHGNPVVLIRIPVEDLQTAIAASVQKWNIPTIRLSSFQLITGRGNQEATTISNTSVWPSTPRTEDKNASPKPGAKLNVPSVPQQNATTNRSKSDLLNPNNSSRRPSQKKKRPAPGTGGHGKDVTQADLLLQWFVDPNRNPSRMEPFGFIPGEIVPQVATLVQRGEADVNSDLIEQAVQNNADYDEAIIAGDKAFILREGRLNRFSGFWQKTTGLRRKEPDPIFFAPADSFDISPSGTILVVSEHVISREATYVPSVRTIKFYSAETGQHLQNIDYPRLAETKFTRIRFSPNGRILACSQYGKGGVPIGTYLWMLPIAASDKKATSQEIHNFRKHTFELGAKLWWIRAAVAFIAMAAPILGRTQEIGGQTVSQAVTNIVEKTGTAPLFQKSFESPVVGSVTSKPGVQGSLRFQSAWAVGVAALLPFLGADKGLIGGLAILGLVLLMKRPLKKFVLVVLARVVKLIRTKVPGNGVQIQKSQERQTQKLAGKFSTSRRGFIVGGFTAAVFTAVLAPVERAIAQLVSPAQSANPFAPEVVAEMFGRGLKASEVVSTREAAEIVTDEDDPRLKALSWSWKSGDQLTTKVWANGSTTSDLSKPVAAIFRFVVSGTPGTAYDVVFTDGRGQTAKWSSTRNMYVKKAKQYQYVDLAQLRNENKNFDWSAVKPATIVVTSGQDGKISGTLLIQEPSVLDVLKARERGVGVGWFKEQLGGVKPVSILTFEHIGRDRQEAQQSATKALSEWRQRPNGQFPHVVLEFSRTGDNNRDDADMLNRVNKGEFDKQIEEWAKVAKEYGKTILLRPFHEPNGGWYPWSVRTNAEADLYISVYKRIVGKFSQAKNVKFAFSPHDMEDANPTLKANQSSSYQMMEYIVWQLHDTIDVIALDAYLHPASGERYMNELITGMLQKFKKYGLPIILGEMSAGIEVANGNPQHRKNFWKYFLQDLENGVYPEVIGFYVFSIEKTETERRINFRPSPEDVQPMTRPFYAVTETEFRNRLSAKRPRPNIPEPQLPGDRAAAPTQTPQSGPVADWHVDGNGEQKFEAARNGNERWSWSKKQNSWIGWGVSDSLSIEDKDNLNKDRLAQYVLTMSLSEISGDFDLILEDHTPREKNGQQVGMEISVRSSQLTRFVQAGRLTIRLSELSSLAANKSDAQKFDWKKIHQVKFQPHAEWNLTSTGQVVVGKPSIRKTNPQGASTKSDQPNFVVAFTAFMARGAREKVAARQSRTVSAPTKKSPVVLKELGQSMAQAIINNENGQLRAEDVTAITEVGKIGTGGGQGLTAISSDEDRAQLFLYVDEFLTGHSLHLTPDQSNQLSQQIAELFSTVQDDEGGKMSYLMGVPNSEDSKAFEMALADSQKLLDQAILSGRRLTLEISEADRNRLSTEFSKYKARVELIDEVPDPVQGNAADLVASLSGSEVGRAILDNSIVVVPDGIDPQLFAQIPIYLRRRVQVISLAKIILGRQESISLDRLMLKTMIQEVIDKHA